MWWESLFSIGVLGCMFWFRASSGFESLFFFPSYRSFTVASINFPGQQHTWRVNPLLQKGSEAAMDSLLNTLAWAAAIINLTASERFVGEVFSIRQSIRSLRMGFHRFLGSSFSTSISKFVFLFSLVLLQIWFLVCQPYNHGTSSHVCTKNEAAI